MLFLNIPIETLTGPAFLGAEPLDRATWLCLMRFCAQHETGGRIEDCAGWGERRWMQLAGVTRGEVRRECPLWRWDGEAVVVAYYPLQTELEVRARRSRGAVGGAAKTPAKASAARRNGVRGGRPGAAPEAQAETQAETQANATETQAGTQANRPETQAGTQGKGREMERKGETPLNPPLVGVSPVDEAAVEESDEAAAQVYCGVFTALRGRHVGAVMLAAVERALAVARVAGVPSERQAELLTWLKVHHSETGVPRLPGPGELVRVNGGLAAWFDRVADARERQAREPRRAGLLKGAREMSYRDDGGEF